MFKKITLIALILGAFTCFAFAQTTHRADIDKFMKTYEELVVQAEKLAKSNSISDLMKLEVKAIELTEQAEKIQEYEEWTIADLQKYTDLTLRYTKAMTVVSNSMNQTSVDTMDALDAMSTMDLSAYGF